MVRNNLLSLLIILFALPLSGRTNAASPNVVLVITDDQGYGDLSIHGNPVLKTPHIDQFAKESVRLTDFHVTPMCTPTRSQLLTGRHCLANGAMNVSSGRTLLRRGIPTLADMFAAAGYRTGLFGKWHLGDNYPYRPQDRGFQKAIWYPSSHIPSAPDHWANDYFDPWFRDGGDWKKFTGYCTDVLFSEASQFIRQSREQSRPFFTYIALNAAHGPLWTPQKYRAMFPDQPRDVASFFGMLVNIDENMGRLESLLAETGLRDNTIVIFMTDNGGTAGVRVFNAGMRGRKIELYDGGHRVPFFVRWPAGKLRPSGDVTELTSCLDVLPTLADFCGLNVPQKEQLDGVNLAGLLRGETEKLPDRSLVVQFSRMNAPRPEKNDATVMWHEWRLVAGKELYDLKSDPAQSKNLFADRPEIATRLQSQYDAFWNRVAPEINTFSRIVIGSDKENPSLLSPCEWQDSFLDQAMQVRRGEKKNGVWGVEVERAGDYEFTLRRWPQESGLAIAAAAPPLKLADADWPAGAALPIARARLKVGDHEETKPVTADTQSIVFSLVLPAGPTQIQTWFDDADGKELCGAYYVYIRRK